MGERPNGEHGFTLVEVLVSVGLVALALAGTLGAAVALSMLPSERGDRALALGVAQNLLVRARAASAYYPRPSDPQATLSPQYADSANLPLEPSSSYDVEVGRAVPQPTGTPTIENVRLHVRTAFVPDRPSDGFAGTFSVAVDYPIAGAPAAGTVQLSTELAAPSFVPGTRVGTNIQEPMRQ
jgi:prepilin-type N-terminal cleavage/methylation domain-containing protein